MEFKKKLKTRLNVGIVYIILGIAIIATTFIVNTKNNFISALGFAMVVLGIVRIRNYLIITKSEESIKKKEIHESDERNVSLQQRAKSTAFSAYLVLAGLVIIFLGIFELTEIMNYISYSVCTLVGLYWIFYFIYTKKS